MTLLRRLTFTFLAVFLVVKSQAAAQVSAAPATEARSTPEVSIEAKVLGMPTAGLAQLGLVLPEPGEPGGASPMGFAVVLLEGEAELLMENSQAQVIHSLKLPAVPGSPTKFRVDTRVPATADNISDNPPYFEAGIAFEVTPKVLPNRNVGLLTSSSVQIRRGPGSAGGPPSMLFETPSINHDIQIPEGKTILLGGFLTAANTSGFPDIPPIPGNPIVSYLLSKGLKKGDDSEIVVLLTPRLTGSPGVIPGPPPMSTTSSAPPPKVEQPIAGTSAALISNPVPPSVPIVVTPSPVSAASAPKIEPSSVASTPDVAASKSASPAVVLSTPNSGTRPPTVTPPVKPAPFFTLQVGAFGSSANAEALLAELKKKFEGAFLDKAETGRTPYRVRVGRVPNAAAARQLQKELADQGFDSFIVPPE